MTMTSYRNLLLTLLIALLSQAGHAESVLYINQKGQEPVTVMLREKPVVTFDATSVHIDIPGMTILYEDVESFTFGSEGKNPTSIAESASERTRFRLTDAGDLLLTGNGQESKVAVYTADGKAVPVSLSHNDNETILHLGHLRRGVYIVKTEHHSFKIHKK